jgi:hypothetical protein
MTKHPTKIPNYKKCKICKKPLKKGWNVWENNYWYCKEHGRQ